MNVTILGGVCYKSGLAYYEFGEKTKTKIVKLSLQRIINKINDPSLVIYMDKHPAHKSPALK